jgi:hypothetical protein
MAIHEGGDMGLPMDNHEGSGWFFFWAEENQPKCYRNPPEKPKKNVVRRGPPGPSRATFFFGFSGGHPCSIQRHLRRWVPCCWIGNFLLFGWVFEVLTFFMLIFSEQCG